MQTIRKEGALCRNLLVNLYLRSVETLPPISFSETMFAAQQLAVVFLAIIARVGATPNCVDTVTLNISDCPPDGAQTVDGSFQSFSIEYGYMGDYAGNLR